MTQELTAKCLLLGIAIKQSYVRVDRWFVVKTTSNFNNPEPFWCNTNKFGDVKYFNSPEEAFQSVVDNDGEWEQ